MARTKPLIAQGPYDNPRSLTRLGRAAFVLGLLVAVAPDLVHLVCRSAVVGQANPGKLLLGMSSAGAAEKPKAPERAYSGKLPGNVAELRDAILAAAHSGAIEDLATAIEWNEMKPDFGLEGGSDPIGHWKRISSDGTGREVLAVLAEALAMPPAKVAIGPDTENSAVFVWPYLAELKPETLKPGEEVDLFRLVSPDIVKAMKDKKKWLWWRLAISADGTWLTFRKYD
ncbi:MAG: hypothetical protein WC807_01315 [Hyphomicrobium sp.]|jgi:hypothetical protein